MRIALAALLAARAAAALPADLDGDGRPELLAVDASGNLTVTGADGRRWGEVAAPPAGATPGAATVEVARSPLGTYVHVKAPLGGGRAVETVARVDGKSLKTIYAEVTGPRGADGEWAEQVRAGGDGVVRYQTAPGVVRCDGFGELFPSLYDPRAGRFRRVAIAPPEGAPLTASTAAPPWASTPPLGLFRFAAASTIRGDDGRADRLAPPRELDDGRPDTAWYEGQPGSGRGAFATARARVPGQAVTGLALTRGPGQPITKVALLVGDERFTVTLPPGRALWVALPKPVPADCVTVAIAEVQGRDAGDSALAEAAIYTARDEAGLAGLVRDVAAGAKPVDELMAILAARGPAAVAEVRAALPGAAGEARRRLLRVAIAAGGREAAELLVDALGTATADERALVADALAGPLG